MLLLPFSCSNGCLQGIVTIDAADAYSFFLKEHTRAGFQFGGAVLGEAEAVAEASE
jgi:hypothetical protein